MQVKTELKAWIQTQMTTTIETVTPISDKMDNMERAQKSSFSSGVYKFYKGVQQDNAQISSGTYTSTASDSTQKKDLKDLILNRSNSKI